MRAIAAAMLALGLVLAFAATAGAAGPAVSIDSGPRGPTNDTTPLFEFTVDPSATTIECSIHQGTPLYLPCSDAYAQLIPLSEGDYTFTVHASDGVEDTFAPQDFTVDTTPPSLSLDPDPSATNDTTPSLGFTVDPSATTIKCSVDQGTDAYEDCTSPYTPTGPLAEGGYTFRVWATDAAGNEERASRSLTVDTTVPPLSIDLGPEGPTNDSTPTFGFSSEAEATFECSVAQGSPAYRTCTSQYTSTSLADGSYTFYVRATDAAGNQTEATRRFDLDTVRPTVSVTSGPRITRISTPTFDFTVTGQTSLQCSIDRGAPDYDDCTTGSSHTAAALVDGSYTFRVLARDDAGNQMDASWRFSIDSAAPALSIDSGPRGPTNDTTPSFGFATEASTTTECSIDRGTAAWAPCTGSHTPAAPLPEGTYTFRVHATDRADNDAIEAQSFTVDTTPPALSITLGPSGATGDSTPLFQFAAEADATVACSIDQGIPAFGPCAGANAHAAAAPLGDGAYTFRVRATDRAGNETTAERSFTVDTVPDAPGPGGSRPDPNPSGPRLLSPFPLVRISGTLTATGARIRLLSVRAPRGALVRVTVTPDCGRARRSSRRCRVRRASGTVGARAVISFRGLARAYRGGTVIVVRVWRADRIGKYTRFTIVRGKAPRRVDQCLMPGATRGSRCPSA